MNYSFGEADKHPKNIELVNERQLNIAKEAEHRYRNIGLPEIYTKEDIVQIFRDGADFADNNPPQGVVNLNDVWHDKSEEPGGYNWSILCQDTGGSCWVENMFVVLLHNTWAEYTAIEMVAKWAYIKDLLPKGGEE